MNDDTTTQRDPCPSFDDLSAWHDGEINSPELDAHLADCHACQTILRDLESFDVEIEQHLVEASPDDETIERIIKRTRRKVGHRKLRLFSFPVLMRVAACLALAAVCTYLVIATQHTNEVLASQTRPPSEAVVDNIDEPQAEDISVFEQKLIQDLLAEFGNDQGTRPAIHNTPANFTDVTLPSTADAADALAARDADVGQNGVLHLSNINLVGYGTPIDNSLSSGREYGTRQPAVIDDRVRHVWLVDDPTAPLKQLQKLMPTHKQDFKELIDQKRDEYVLQFVITDTDLQGLVDHFNGLGFKLMSPQEPQPGHAQSLRLSGKTVQYEVDFVRK